MKLLAATLLAAGMSCVVASTRHRCATGDTPAEMMFDVADLENSQQWARKGEQEPYIIDTYVHVVTSEAKEDSYDEAMVYNQIKAMNDAYAPNGFNFTVKGLKFHVNDDWASAEYNSLSEARLKKETRLGTYADLNLWFISDMDEELTTGYCRHPSFVPFGKDYLLDGCVIHASTMPGSSVWQEENGATAIHETGHWLGLMHTFGDYKCSGPGDFVSDTPQESESHWDANCTSPHRPDSCPGISGFDPMFNYMDYSHCTSEFTPQQGLRMRWTYSNMRAGSLV